MNEDNKTVHSICVQRLLEVRERVRLAAEKCGRSPSDITIVGVTKQHGIDAFLETLDFGHVDFGENRVQEAMEKWPSLVQEYPQTRLHLIGPLQTNKVKDAVLLFDAIHSVDRMKLAAKIAEILSANDKSIDLFVQVNTGEESQKAGVFPREADQFIKQCRQDLGLSVTGLMCIPPIDEEAALHFALLSKIAERNNIACLSMGMSNDFEKAIAFGATHIRVGSAIFGPRPVKGTI